MRLARLLFLGSLLTLVACAGAEPSRPQKPDPDLDPDPEPNPNPTPAPTPKLTSYSFQCDPDSELWDDAVKAAATWAAATGLQVTVSAAGDTPILLVDAFDPRCPDHTGSARGCSRVTEDPSDSFTQIPTYLHWSVRYGTILHEMGHHLRGTNEHVSNPEAVMYAQRALDHTTLLPDDVAFVCSGPRMQCPAELPL